MFAAHFAAGLAIKGHVPETPIRPLLVAVFIPDVLWIVLAATGVEPTKPTVFFDGWSHSLVMVLAYAATCAFAFRGRGRAVAAAMAVAVLSHFVLDMPIHPKPLELYPHSAIRFDLGIGTVAPMRYWEVQLAVTLALLAVYVTGMRQRRQRWRETMQTCVGVVALHIILMPG